MSESLTVDQARVQLVAQDYAKIVDSLVSEKATLSVRVMQLEGALEQAQARVSQLEQAELERDFEPIHEGYAGTVETHPTPPARHVLDD